MTEEVSVLMMAEYFHILPEDVEARASKKWFRLWQIYLEEKNRGR
jgi:hypothetical protein